MTARRTSESYAQRLIAVESRAGDSATGGQAAFRVCEKLRRPLITLVGTNGFRSLLARAVSLAKSEAPWLGGVTINPDGSISYAPEVEASLDSAEAGRAGAAVVAELLGLLFSLIGESLTFRVLQGVWPKTLAQPLKIEDQS